MARHFNYNVVKIKNDEGEYIAIPALQGKTLYETAVEFGFTGTEDEWFEMLITDGWITPYQEFKDEYNEFVNETFAAHVQLNADFEEYIQKRKINGHQFNADVTITAEDVGATRIDMANVDLAAFTAKGAEAGFQTAGVTANQVAFNDDGSITETGSGGEIKHTVFNEDGSITENYTLATGQQLTKTITFNSDGSISESVAQVTTE